MYYTQIVWSFANLEWWHPLSNGVWGKINVRMSEVFWERNNAAWVERSEVARKRSINRIYSTAVCQSYYCSPCLFSLLLITNYVLQFTCKSAKFLPYWTKWNPRIFQVSKFSVLVTSKHSKSKNNPFCRCLDYDNCENSHRSFIYMTELRKQNSIVCTF